jgi:short-subunit dehydrogenase
MRRQPASRVVVITGASSGIGRATALAFAMCGCHVVLAARRKHALESLAEHCRREGVEALVVPTDVADEGQVQALAARTVEAFGRIDVWINNAGVAQFGRFDETPSQDFRRVIETNFFGSVHGARVALARFREQGYGTLILVGSVVGAVPQAFTSAYAASKHAMRGLADSLRMELSLDDAPGIRICSVLPASYDTPIFTSAANHVGWAPCPLTPTNDPAALAAALVRLAASPRREVVIGRGGRTAMVAHALAPALYEWVMARVLARHHFEPRAVPRGPGNLYEPATGPATIHGGFGRSPDGSTELLGKLALAGAIGLLASAALHPMARRGRDHHG